MAKFIVTGAAGFIGRNLVAGLNARGETDIILVDDLGTSEKWKNLIGLSYTDILSVDDFIGLVMMGEMEPPETVFHLGACSATTEKDADYLLKNNYSYTRALCEWCLDNEVRFIYASSAATYGDGELGYSDADVDTPKYSPLNMYGYSKHMFDLIALREGWFDRIVGLKYFNVYGPYEDHKADMRSVPYKAHAQILETGELGLFKSYKPEYEDGCQKRDFVYVGDAVDVSLFFHENPFASGLFNCGTGISRTWLDLGKAVFSAMGKEPNIKFVEMPDVLQGKYQYFTQADGAKLAATGYDKPFTSLEDGVKQTVDYLQS